MKDCGESLTSNWNPRIIAHRTPEVKFDSLTAPDFLWLNSVASEKMSAGMIVYSSVVGNVGECEEVMVWM